MIFKEKNILSRAKNDDNYMNDLLRTEDAQKFIKFVIKSYTKNPSSFMLQNKVEWDDLYQACLIGLYNGIKKIELERNPNEWVRYLYLNIQGELRNFSRSNQSNSIVISQRIRQMYSKYISFYHSFRELNGKDPSISDTMSEFQISRNDAFDLVYGMQDLVDFFQKTGEINIELNKNSFENVEKEVVNKLLIQEYMLHLNSKERNVIYMYYFLGLKKSEIAKEISCGNSMVHKHIGNAFRKIRNIM